MDLNSAKIFVNVVRKGSFSAAAKSMGIPVATVSRRVSELESSLDLRLLERTTRSLRLTDSGSTLYEFVSRGVEEMDAGLLALLEQEQNLKGHLRLSLPPSFEPMWTVIDQFQDSYPNIQIDLFSTERRIDFIEDGVDLVLRIGDINSQSSVARKLLTYRHKLVASPEFLKGKVINTPDDLFTYQCAAWAQKDKVVSWLLGDKQVKVTATIKANDYTHMRHLALNHRAITELPAFHCDRYIKSGQLIEVLPDYPMLEQPVNLVYPSRKSVSRITRVFIDYCIENFKI